MEDKFDVIIVGGGLAGAAAALTLARQGYEILVIERGDFAGAKNMSGGRIYSHSLKKLIPDFEKDAPVERRVFKEKISMMTETAATTVEFSGECLLKEGCDSYTVLRSSFDRWLLSKAEDAGAMVITGVLVDDVIKRDGKICGITANSEEMLANIVILADGANSLLISKSGLRNEKIKPYDIAVGAKEVIELDEKIINDRFGLSGEEGAAWLFAGFPSCGNIGGGFIYTNKSSLSLGIVVTLSEMKKSEKSVHRMMEDFKNHPIIRPLIKDGKLLEYSGHMVPEGGYNSLPSFYDDGVLVAGDSAGFVINAGYTVRGMDLAIQSGVSAAEACIYAKEKNDFSKDSLSKYKDILDNSFVMKDMRHFAKFPKFMDNKRIFNDYPRMAEEVMSNIFIVDGTDPKSMYSKIMKPVKKVGLLNVVKDSIKGVRAL